MKQIKVREGKEIKEAIRLVKRDIRFFTKKENLTS